MQNQTKTIEGVIKTVESMQKDFINHQESGHRRFMELHETVNNILAKQHVS